MGGGPRGQSPLAINWPHLFHQQSLFPVSAECCLFSPVSWGPRPDRSPPTAPLHSSFAAWASPPLARRAMGALCPCCMERDLRACPNLPPAPSYTLPPGIPPMPTRPPPIPDLPTLPPLHLVYMPAPGGRLNQSDTTLPYKDLQDMYVP